MQDRAPKIIEAPKGNDPFQDFRLALKAHGGDHATELGLQYLATEDLGDQLMLVKRENLLFCLWRHEPRMVEVAVEAIEKKLGDKLQAYRRLVVLQEQVGGSAKERVDETLWTLLSWISARGPTPADEGSANLDSDLNRELGHEIGKLAERHGLSLDYRNIDISATHPKYDLTREFLKIHHEKYPALEHGYDSDPTSRARYLKDQRALFEEHIRIGSEMVKSRDAVLSRQIHFLAGVEDPDTLVIVFVGAMHKAVSRGSDKVIATLTAEDLSPIPTHFEHSLNCCLLTACSDRVRNGIPNTESHIQRAQTEPIVTAALDILTKYLGDHKGRGGIPTELGTASLRSVIARSYIATIPDEGIVGLLESFQRHATTSSPQHPLGRTRGETGLKFLLSNEGVQLTAVDDLINLGRRVINRALGY